MNNLFNYKKFTQDISNVRLQSVDKVNGESENGFYYVDVRESVFDLGGITHPDKNHGEYYRLDASKKADYSDNNRFLAECTPGVCVRFITDAKSIMVKAELRAVIAGMHHFCDKGVYGFDAYVGTGNERFYCGGQMQTFVQTVEGSNTELKLPDDTKEVQINFPLYGGVSRLCIGFPNESKIAVPTNRSLDPIAFYGSSITQGGCVSRPGSMYSEILCRIFNCDCRNFGFSGSAMGELAVADYIANQKLSCFVMDYDYNSPSVEHLEKTHFPFFEYIRKIQPNLPVVFVSHPFYADITKADRARIAVVKKTYDKAVANGDKNVYFISSNEFFPREMRDLCAVDNLHPNDLGQFFMAKRIYKTLKNVL